MEIDIDLGTHPLFHIPVTATHYEIVDVDDGHGHTEQIIITNDPFHGLSVQQEAEADEFIGRRYGKYRPLFNGAIVVGPQASKLFISLFGFLALGALLGLLFPTISNELSPVIFYFGEIIVFICISLLFWTSVTDPGIIPRDFNLNQYLMQVGNSNNGPAPPLRPRWCRKCQSARPPRCYHCRECEICIRRQDMHLFVGGLCIGTRNFRQYLAFNVAASVLAFYVLTVSITLVLKILDKYPKEATFTRMDFHLSCILMFCGATLISFPQTGFIMFVYRVYLISRNRTMREEYRAYIRAYDFNPFDVGIILNLWEFLGRPIEPSYLRRKKNQVDPCTDLRHRWREVAIPDRGEESNALYFPSNVFGARRTSSSGHERLNETERGRQALNLRAKVKSHYSLPTLDNGELPLIPGLRIRRNLFPRPLDLLEQQIKQYKFCQSLPKSVRSCKKFKSVYRSLSESCMNEAGRDVSDIIHQARAHQIQQIISCVLRRDRGGLVELARRIDVAGLVGMDHFDPDDIQMIELNNGLPLLSARSPSRRNPLAAFPQNQREETQNSNPLPSNARRNALGIPQMVAAGLMPTIRRQQQHAATALALAHIHDYSCTNDLSRSYMNDPSPPPSTLFVPGGATIGSPLRRNLFRGERQRRRSILLARVNACRAHMTAVCNINETTVPSRSRRSIRSRNDTENNNNNVNNSSPRLSEGQSATVRRSTAECDRNQNTQNDSNDGSNTDRRICVVFVDNEFSGQPSRSS